MVNGAKSLAQNPQLYTTPVNPTGPTDAQLGTNRGYMAANRVDERCLPERLGKS